MSGSRASHAKAPVIRSLPLEMPRDDGIELNSSEPAGSHNSCGILHGSRTTPTSVRNLLHAVCSCSAIERSFIKTLLRRVRCRLASGSATPAASISTPCSRRLAALLFSTLALPFVIPSTLRRKTTYPNPNNASNLAKHRQMNNTSTKKKQRNGRHVNRCTNSVQNIILCSA